MWVQGALGPAASAGWELPQSHRGWAQRSQTPGSGCGICFSQACWVCAVAGVLEDTRRMLRGYLATRGCSLCLAPLLAQGAGTPQPGFSWGGQECCDPPSDCSSQPKKMLFSADSHQPLSPRPALHGARPQWATVAIQPLGVTCPLSPGGCRCHSGGPKT